MSQTDRLPIATPAEVRAAGAGLLRGERTALAATLGAYVVAAIAGLAAPWLVGRIVDTVANGGSASTVDLLAGIIVAAVLVHVLFVRLARLAAGRLGERILADLRERFVARALRIPLSIVERAGAGDLMTRASADVGTVGGTIRSAVPEIVLCVSQALFILGAVFVVEPWLGLVALVGAPPMYAVTRWYLRRARSAYLVEGASISDVSESMAATVSGARTIDTFRLAPERIADGETQIGRSYRARMATLRLRSVFFPVLDVSQALPTALVLFVGGAMYINDLVGLGAVVAATLYMTQLTDPLAIAFMWVEQVQRGAASLARVEGVGGLVTDTDHSGASVPIGDAIALRDVRFRYDTGPEVLRGIDLDIRPGERLAIVGPSGAGKSTMARLLAGIDPPTGGRITIGGVDVTAVDPRELRARVLLLTQDHHLFSASLRDNLRFAAPHATDEALWSALDTVSADWARRLPDGLDTALGASATTLSDASVQQLALARVVLADPRVLILDEATARLDPSTARGAERALARVLADRTVISIAHRLHTARAADRIAVVEDGRVTELGSHDDLLDSGGAYAALWRSWHGDS